VSKHLDHVVSRTGCRFKLYPQPRWTGIFNRPETVYLSSSPAEISPGPSDSRMYVVDATGKEPYREWYLPPHIGTQLPPVQPGPDGHFDYLDINSRPFLVASLYATVHRVLDIWEGYLGRIVNWSDFAHGQRLELIPLIMWSDAHAGLGFLEFGFGPDADGQLDTERPHCANFDIVAHEVGHSIVFSVIGEPTPGTVTDEFRGFHESVGDLVATIALLHFDSILDYLLDRTAGNLFTINLLSRIGELNQSKQLRVTFNERLMSNVTTEAHDLSKPLTGAIFDVLVEVFQDILLGAGAISESLSKRSFHVPGRSAGDPETQVSFDNAYKRNPEIFKIALVSARDYVGSLLAATWNNIDADYLSYRGVGDQLLESDRMLTGGKYASIILSSFNWRGINVGGTAPNPTLARSTPIGLV
jgi:hypothetical protein